MAGAARRSRDSVRGTSAGSTDTRPGVRRNPARQSQAWSEGIDGHRRRRTADGSLRPSRPTRGPAAPRERTDSCLSTCDSRHWFVCFACTELFNTACRHSTQSIDSSDYWRNGGEDLDRHQRRECRKPGSRPEFRHTECTLKAGPASKGKGEGVPVGAWQA
jgi:hypothetical protein